MKDKVSTWCVPSSVFCALVYAIKEKKEVRIAVFKIKDGVDHVQAQVKDGDEWRYITEVWTGESMAAITYGKNHPKAKEPYKYMSVMEFLEQQEDALDLNLR